MAVPFGAIRIANVLPAAEDDVARRVTGPGWTPADQGGQVIRPVLQRRKPGRLEG